VQELVEVVCWVSHVSLQSSV